MWQDIRVAWRFLRKAPTTTTVAVVTLGVAVALGAGTLALLDETVWRPLRSHATAPLVTIYNQRPAAPRFQVLSYPDYAALRDRLHDRVSLAAFVRVFAAVSAGDRPARVQGELVSGNYFAVLGARPFRGRLIDNTDDTPGGAVIVLSHELWRSAFGSTPDIVGRRIRVDRRDVTVVGVAGADLHPPAYRSQFWMPLTEAQRVFGGLDVLSRADVPVLQTVGVLQEHVSRAALQGLIEGWPTTATREGWSLVALPGAYLRFWPAYRDTVTWFLGIFVALAGCVLLAACANLAGLLLARQAERGRDLAIRHALGATSGQLLRRLLAESLILSTLGGGLGLLLAIGAAGAASQLVLPVPVTVALSPDLRLAALTLGVCLAASLAFTTMFAGRGLRREVARTMAETGGALARRTRAQSALVVLQVAVACVCLTGAGLLARSAIAVGRINVGFDPARITSALISLPGDAYDAAGGLALFDRLQQDLSAQPGIEAVALEWNQSLGSIRSTGQWMTAGGPDLTARYNAVGPAYFDALRIPIAAGRGFDGRDGRTTEPVLIVNETMAARLGGTALDRLVTLGRERTPRRVVGIVRDTKYNGITEGAQPFAYLPLAQAYRGEVWIHVRTADPNAGSLIRSRLAAIDRDVPVSDVHTLAAQVDEARATPRISARFSAATAGIAIFLALVGVYGLLAASVEQRRRELSIRAALGASPRDILAQVGATGLRLTGVGLVLGMPAAALASPLLAALVYGVSPHDALVFALVPAAIVVVSIPAWLAPARRAAGASPVDALRQP